MSHSAHPDVHTHGLADGCTACEEHASQPTHNLDEWMLRDLLSRALDRTIPSRSTTEAVAVANVLNILERVGRLAQVEPTAALRYLQRWRIYARLEADET